MRADVKRVRQEAEEGRIIECRVRILRFADEISHRVEHTKDHYDQVMEDCEKYEKYTIKNPDFKNNITEASQKLIKDTYFKLFKTHDFL